MDSQVMKIIIIITVVMFAGLVCLALVAYLRGDIVTLAGIAEGTLSELQSALGAYS